MLHQFCIVNFFIDEISENFQLKKESLKTLDGNAEILKSRFKIAHKWWFLCFTFLYFVTHFRVRLKIKNNDLYHYKEIFFVNHSFPSSRTIDVDVVDISWRFFCVSTIMMMWKDKWVKIYLQKIRNCPSLVKKVSMAVIENADAAVDDDEASFYLC